MPQKSQHDRYPAPDPYRTWRFLVIQDFAKTKTYRGRNLANALALFPILQARHPQARIIFQAQLWIDVVLTATGPTASQEPTEAATHA